MIRQQIDSLVLHRAVPRHEPIIEVIETFISWIILCEKYTYKIKRPVHLSFLDFSTMERRKNFCLQEYYLNRQLAGDMYIDVLPVTDGDRLKVGGNGKVIDYGVRMKSMDNAKLMSVLLTDNKVGAKQVGDLATIIANFHKKARVIYRHAGYNLTEKFKDIVQHVQFLSDYLSHAEIETIYQSVELFEELSTKFTPRFIERVKLGFFRSCHGDLHSGNVFLMSKPIPFDRIEFDHELSEIDVLNEIAFMCMDLECFDKPDLSQHFFETYNFIFPTVITKDDEQLFLLYKAYRANICIKVNCLKARCTSDFHQKLNCLGKARRYLEVLSIYLRQITHRVINELENVVI